MSIKRSYKLIYQCASWWLNFRHEHWKVINVFGKNIVDGAEVALSYALLGGFAALISYSGITDYLVGKIINAIHAENSRWSRVKVKVTIIIVLLAMSIMSQNLIPVHIAFIPIVIPHC